MMAVRPMMGHGIMVSMRASPLADWLMAECNRRGLSYRRASLDAGIANNGIAEIINSGSKPSLDRLLKLAHYFTVAPEFLIRLAGQLPSQSDIPDIPRLHEFLSRLDRLPPERQQAIVGTALMILDMVQPDEALSAAVSASSPKVDARDS